MSPTPLNRSMTKILRLMNAAASDGDANYHAELVTDGHKWYVGAEAVDAAAGRQLVMQNLVMQCSKDGVYTGYSITHEARNLIDGSSGARTAIKSSARIKTDKSSNQADP